MGINKKRRLSCAQKRATDKRMELKKGNLKNELEFRKVYFVNRILKKLRKRMGKLRIRDGDKPSSELKQLRKFFKEMKKRKGEFGKNVVEYS